MKDNTCEYDPVADRIVEIEHDCIASPEFQKFVRDVIERGEAFLRDVECDVRAATGEDGVDMYGLDAILRAARALRVPAKKTATAAVG